MTDRTRALLYGPVVAALPFHIVLLVLATRNMPTHGPWRPGDPWTTWNLAAPVLLLFAFGYVTRKLNEAEEAESEPVARGLLKWTWGAALVDLVVTAGWLVLRLI